MTEKFAFLREALLNLPEHTIRCGVYPSGGKCDSYETMYPEKDLTNPELLYLLKKYSDVPELFDGLPMKEISKKELDNLAYDACYPNEYICISEIPTDLEEIAYLYDEDDHSEFFEAFNDLSDDEYTFYYTIEGFDYDEPVSIRLTAEQARGLIIDYLGISVDSDNWCPYTVEDVTDQLSTKDFLPEVSFDLDEVAESDDFLLEIHDIIREFLAEDINEEEATERFENVERFEANGYNFY